MSNMTNSIEDAVLKVAEFQRSKYFGKYRGVVVDNEDDEGLGRVTAEVPAVYGDQISPWAMPCVPFAGAAHGAVFLPEVGDGVWIEFEGGDLARPIWSGVWWAEGQMPEGASTTARMISTSAGHQVVLDEEADEMKLIHPGGPQIVMTGEDITLTAGQCTLKITGSEIVINEGMAKITTAGASLVNDAFKVGS